MKSLIVDNKFNEKKLNSFLLNSFEGLCLNDIYKALRKKDIRVNGKRVSENVTLFCNDIVDVYIIDDILFRTPTVDLEIVYEDNFILVINKPIGLEVVGDNSLTSIIHNKFGANVNPCHRLDRNTTGLVLFAKTDDALFIMMEKFKNREIEKHYSCLVYGFPKCNHELLTGYLFKDSKKSLVYISDVPKKGYQKIITEYTLISKSVDSNTSILDINLHTR